MSSFAAKKRPFQRTLRIGILRSMIIKIDIRTSVFPNRLPLTAGIHRVVTNGKRSRDWYAARALVP
jgi:hypothetical protein